MRARQNRARAALYLGVAAAPLLGSFIGCAQALGIEKWQDPPGNAGAGGRQDTASDGAGGTGGEGGNADPTCADHKKNGLETDVDCGGDACGPCALGMACANNADCATKSCSANVCIKGPIMHHCEPSEGGATCNDCMKNGDETDIDCGGDACGPCEASKDCLDDADCQSGVCAPQVDGRSSCSP